jgi:uncharacterized Ntn-hydrolase superfamily protein
MTYSIVAANAELTQFGVAVASKFLAAGAVAPAARAAVGALATQSWANTGYKASGLAMLAGGATAAETVKALTEADELREKRQLGIVDAHGGSATYTGSECADWAGGVSGSAYAIQGNVLAGSRVVALMEEAWLGSDPSQSLAHRLLAALKAGDAAGGDSRGRQCASIYVVGDQGTYGDDDVVVDLRVDDHTDPVRELARLLDLHDMMFGKPDPNDLLTLEATLAAEVRSLLGGRGHIAGDVSTEELDRVLANWAGIENLEARLVPGRIDPVVLEHLRRTSTSEA